MPLTLKERIVSALVARRLRKTLGMTRAEWRRTMKPFPKWMALIFAAPAVYAAIKSGDWMLGLSLIGGALGLSNTHSLTGTGGKTQ
jgi:hypothetical protein